MRRLGAADRWLLGVLLLAWLLCLGFHVKEILRTGFAEPAIYAAAAPTPGAHPRVGGFRLERGRGGGPLAVGDKLLSVGGRDLAGAGYIAFDAIALAEAGLEPRVPLVVEREGVRHSVELEILASGFPWYRVVPIAVWVLVATLVLLRAPGESSRKLFSATLCVAILSTPFYGSSVLQSTIALWLFNAIGGITFMLVLRFAIGFPYEIREQDRLPVGLAAIGALWWLVRIPYFVATPIPSDVVPLLTVGFDGVFVLTALAIVTRNYVKADPVGRRRVKWMLLTAYLGVAPLGVIVLLPILAPGIGSYEHLFEFGVMLFVIVPVGVLIGVLRYNLYDVDRLISATASYSSLGVFLLATVLMLLPRVARAGSDLLGIDSGTGQTALSVLLAFAIVPAHQRLRPQLERIFFRERHAIEQGIENLLGELSMAPGPEPLARLVSERLDELLRPECTILYMRGGDNTLFEPAFVRGGVVPPAFEADSLLMATLQRRKGPLTREALSDGKADVEIGPFERAALETLGVPLVLPIRRGAVLAGIVCLGPKRSGDVYTSTDVALLTAVVDKVASGLEHFDQLQLLEAGKAMQAALRRYVPGAIAEQIEAGVDLEAGERVVTVLFVDIRSYTSYAETREAGEVFSTVNAYTETVSHAVREYGGTVVEFNGDGMMVVFGAPTPLPEKERSAVVAARRVAVAVSQLSEQAGAPLSVGIGIATGPAFVGNIRAVDRLIWSAIGNTTNLAARLQSLTRDLDATLVVDGPTWQSAHDVAEGWVAYPRTPVRGRSEPIDLYALPLAAEA